MGDYLAVDELEAIDRRRDPNDVPRLVAEVRRLNHLAEQRADEILRLSRLLDDLSGEHGTNIDLSGAG